MPSREPSQTYHPERRASLHLPSISAFESIAGGAHFSAVTDDPNKLSPRHSRNSSGRGAVFEEEVVLTGARKRVFEDVLLLFCCRPTKDIFERSWRKDAIFEDPLCKCHGYEEYAPQWFAMPKLFSNSRTLSATVISSTREPEGRNRIVYEQEQEYTVRFLNLRKVISSVVVIDLDDTEMITKLEDKWSGQDHPTRWGTHLLRRMNAKTLPWLVRVPHREQTLTT
ncbi:hypothetical protein FRC03_004427 [Tulasnella sp. 419]|nr:hypothetical protein FRC03_004427 [Tulasnella sp. 419]